MIIARGEVIRSHASLILYISTRRQEGRDGYPPEASADGHTEERTGNLCSCTQKHTRAVTNMPYEAYDVTVSLRFK